MSDYSTVILLPFIIAFLIFVMRFYSRESASSMRNPSFLFGVLTVIVAGGYLMLRITNSVPPFGTLIFGLAGVALLVTAIARMFMI